MAFISRYLRRRIFRPRIILLTAVLMLFLDAYTIVSHHPTPVRTKALSSHLASEKIYIVSIARNSEYMLRLYWSEALFNLVTHLGPENVFVSIYESGSQEDTKGALRELEQSLNALGVETKFVLGMTMPEQVAELGNVPGPDQDRTGWIFTGRNVTGWEVRRIPYLAKARNKAMEPLIEMEQRRRFDKVLWINDIVFTTEDVTTLLSTRDGDYTAACALDFAKSAETYSENCSHLPLPNPPLPVKDIDLTFLSYDTFALRDSAGDKTSTLTYPYFSSSQSLHALYSLQPIPVQSCWNGLISMSAAPFYPSSLSSPNPRPALKFRGVPDSLAKHHLEGSECCLIHSDMRAMSGSDHRLKKGVWLNPNVRVAFNASSYSKVNGGMEVKSSVFDIIDRDDRGGLGVWPGQHEKWKGIWLNRFARWTGWVRAWSEVRIVERRVESWKEAGRNMKPPEEREEVGTECLINEMQVLYQNGWQHL